MDAIAKRAETATSAFKTQDRPAVLLNADRGFPPVSLMTPVIVASSIRWGKQGYFGQVFLAFLGSTLGAASKFPITLLSGQTERAGHLRQPTASAIGQSVTIDLHVTSMKDRDGNSVLIPAATEEDRQLFYPADEGLAQDCRGVVEGHALVSDLDEESLFAGVGRPME